MKLNFMQYLPLNSTFTHTCTLYMYIFISIYTYACHTLSTHSYIRIT